MLTRRAALAASMAVLARPALAAWPERPVRLVVPFAAGGNLDTLMRLAAPLMSARLGQPIVVENRVGAGGNVGAEAVARSAPDGYTILVGSNGPITSNPILMARMPYDAAKDFVPVGLAFRTPNVLVVSPRLPVNTLAEFVAYAKARPGQLACSSAGTGTTNHLNIELLNAATGMGLTHIPYRSSGNATPDLLSGALASSLDQITTAMPMHRSGQLKIIGLGLPDRIPALPDVQTFKDVGVEGGGLVAFIALFAPTGTPAEAISRLQAALAGALTDTALRERVEGLGNLVATPEQATPQGLAAMLQQEIALSRRAVQLAGIQPQ